ncbi:MAG: helix-turn-helix transcriptional regulator [Capsulimonadaceae bacterium]|nr:helix-turn-helix transcriptional regulator [Capsulimonadaceae bacterium]
MFTKLGFVKHAYIMPDEILRSKIAAEVKRLRDLADKTQEDLADESGLHTNYISLAERAKTSVTVDALKRIAKALGVSLAQFFESIDE